MGFATQICDVPLGHLNNPEFGDSNGRILFSVEPTGNTNEYKVTIKPNGGSKKLDYLYIELGNGATTSPYPITAGTDDNGDEFDEMIATFTYTGSTGSMASIQWSNPDWGGRWGCKYDDINFASLQACGAVCADSEDPTVSAVSVGSISYSSAVLTITASDNVGGSGISQYIVKNGASQIASSTTTPITVTGLSSGTTYDNIKVIAKDACDNESSEYTVASFTTLTRESECIGAKGHFGNPSVKKVYYQIDYVGGNAIINLRSLTGNNLAYAEVQITGVGNYGMTPDGNGGYTYTINSPTVNAEWYLRFLYRDTSMPGNEMTAETQSASDANIIYYKVGECTSTETENANIALSSAGASATASSGTAANAIDDNEGSRWESDFEDPQWICVDFGARKVFNKVQLLHQTAYIKSFQIQVSDDGTNFITIKNVSETLTDFDGEKKLQNIDLGGKFAARYLRIYGTERGTQWGYSLFELRAMYATTPVLTTYTLSIPTSFCTIGTTYPLTLTAKDQLGNDFAVTSTYSVSPAGAGTITSAGVYTPSVAGNATIIVEGGGKSASVSVRNEVSANLAFERSAVSGHDASAGYAASLANNSNLSDRWASGEAAVHYRGGTNPDFEDWWYVDLGGYYDIAEIAIKWETARPNDYDIRISNDASTWTNLGVYNTYPAANGNDDLNYEYYNSLASTPGRYVGVWAREGYGDPSLRWGISMYDIQVFGLEHVDAGVNVTNINLSQVSATIEESEPLKLTAEVLPLNASDKSLTWSSTDETVATVDGGVITTHKDGTTTITATANDGSGVYGECALTVVPISAKTYWGTYTVTAWDNMPLLWSVTRNSDRTLTYTVYYGGDASGYATRQLNDGVGGTDGWHNLSGYTDADRVASYTTETKYVKGTQLSPNPFFYFGGPRIDLPTSYRVGDSNERPSSAVESVIISAASAKIVKNETLQLTANVLPSFVENKTIIWSSSNTSVADVSSAGLVTAKEVGTAVITATSAADGTKTATCAITVSATLPSATWYGRETFTPGENLVGINYSVTRNTNHTLTYKVSFSENVTGMEAELNDGPNPEDYHNMGYNQSTCSAEWTSSQTYADGEIPTSFFWLKYAGGVKRIDVKDFYTVGADNEDSKPNVYVTLNDEDTDNASRINFHDNKVADVFFARAFIVDDAWYTLCLPFDMSAAQVNEVFGSSKLATLVDAEDRGSLIHLNFDYKNAIEAGMPYLFKPGMDFVSGTTISNVEIKSATPTQVGDALMKFQGTFNQIKLTEENQRFVGPDNYLYSPASGGTTMGAFRCYFTIPNGSPGLAPGKRARIVFGEQTATGLSDIEAQHPKAAKFMLDGMLYIIRDGKTYNAQGMLVK